MIEIDGPPAAFFEESNGERHTYTVWSYAGKHAGDLLHIFSQWRIQYEDSTRVLVWRVRPEVTYEQNLITHDDLGRELKYPEGRWKIYWRCTKVPLAASAVYPIVPTVEGGVPVFIS